MSSPLRLAALLAALLCCLGPSVGDVHAQNATVRGFVTDADDGQALFGVNVILRGADGALLGTATDAEGFFIIPRVPAGTYAFEARYIGYAAELDTLVLAAGEVVTRNVALGTDAAEMGEVVVETEREAGAARVTAGLQTVGARDIELIPTPDVSADLVNYLTALPGIVSSGDRGGQLFIRGGEPTQNLVLLDGMMVFQPFHILGFYSAFPADLVRSTDVYAGGFGAKFGGRLSSVIDVDTRNGNNRSYSGAVTVAPFVSSARIEGPIVPGRVSLLASARQSVIEEGASQLVDQDLPYEFGDRFGKLHVLLNRNNQLSVSALHTSDRGVVGVGEEGADLDDATLDQVHYENLAAGVRYVVLPATLPVFAEILASYSSLDQRFGPQDDPVRTAAVNQFNGSVDVTYYSGLADVHWGLFIRTYELDNELGGQFQNVTSDTEFVTEAGAYMEPELRLSPRLTLTPGLRLHSFPSSSRTFLEPRARLVWKAGIHQVSSAWGLYHQEITGLNDRRDAGDVFTAWAPSPLNEVPRAMHALLGYQLSTESGIDASLEGYYKDLSNLSIAEWTAFPRFSTNLQPADGTALGFDVRFGYTNDWFSGFLTYGYADVEYEARGRSIPIWYGEAGQAFNPPHDRTHQVSAVGNLSVLGFELSARWQYGSGLPFSQALGFDRFILLAGPTDVRGEPGRTRVLYGTPYGGRLPDYHRLDVSLERTLEVPHAALTLQAGVINAYDRANLFYMDLFTLRRVDQLPLIPSFGLKLELK